VHEKDLRRDDLPGIENPPVVTQQDTPNTVEQQPIFGYDSPVSSAPPCDADAGHPQSRGRSHFEQGYPTIAKKPDTELIIPDEDAFDYSQLAAGEANKLAESRKQLLEDPHYPRYHFSSPEHRLNDPNGLCYWQGRWHLFYQGYPPEDPRQHYASIRLYDDGTPLL